MTQSRLELTPLNFLRRCASTLGERPAVVHGDRRYELRGAQRALQPVRQCAARPRHRAPRARRGAVPEHPGAARGPLRHPARRRRDRGTEHPAQRRGDRVHPRRLRRALAVRRRGVEVAGRGRATIETIVVEDSGEEDDPYEAFVADGSADPPESRLEDENEPIAINYTSGTTGRSKGAIYTHRGAYLRAHGVAHETGLTYDSVHLWTLPMFHCSGWCLTVGSDRRRGARTCACARSSRSGSGSCSRTRASRTTAARRRSTSASSTTTSAHPLEQRVTVPTGGSPPSPTLLKRMRELNLHPIHLYGLTETYGPIMGCSWQPAVGRAGHRGAGAAAGAPGRHLQRLGPRPRGRRRHERRPARRRDDGRDRAARQQRDGRLPQQPRGHRGGVQGRLVPLRRSRASGTPTATSSCATGPRT